MPDLVLAIGSTGEVGYAYVSDLNGGLREGAESPLPEDLPTSSRDIALYDSDGTTVIDTYTVNSGVGGNFGEATVDEVKSGPKDYVATNSYGCVYVTGTIDSGLRRARALSNSWTTCGGSTPAPQPGGWFTATANLVKLVGGGTALCNAATGGNASGSGSRIIYAPHLSSCGMGYYQTTAQSLVWSGHMWMGDGFSATPFVYFSP